VSRAAALLKGVLALAALVGLAAGVPWALVHFVGWPLPHALPTWAQLRSGLTQHGIADATLLKALACVVWAAWALLVISLAVETPAAVRGRIGRPIRAAGPLQPIVAHLVAAVAIAALSLSARPQPAPRPLHISLQPATGQLTPAAALAAMDLHASIRPDGAPPIPPSLDGGMSSYLVQRNDTLWGIAQSQLGDPLRWRELFELNQDRPQPDGSALTDPHWIRPGWTLILPAQTPTPQSAPATPPAARSLPPAPSVPPPSPPATTEPAAPSARSPLTVPAGGGEHSPSVPSNGSHAEPDRPGPPAAVSLPDGAVVSGAFAAGVLSAVAVGRLRRRHGHQPNLPEAGRCLAAPPLGPTIRRLASALARDEEPPAPGAPSPQDSEEARVVPDLIDVAEIDGRPITARLAVLSGVAVAGAAADDVARAWLAALLTRAGPLAAEAMAATATLQRLLPGLGETPGLRPATDSASLVRALEAEILARTRLLADADANDDVSYRRAHPAEPLPALLCLAENLDPHLQARLVANLTAVPRLGITVIFLADTPGAAGRLNLEGRTVISAEPADKFGWLAGASLFALPAGDALDVLRVLADAEFRPTSDADPEWTEVIDRMEHPSPPAEPWPEPAPAAQGAEQPVRVDAFGPLTITVAGTTISRGLRSAAKELLLYYLLRPEGATVEQAVEHLWPDTDPKLVHRQFWTPASNLRSRLRQHLGTDIESKILDQTGEVYRLAPDVVGADLWDFQAALADAARAGDDAEAARAALRRGVEAYRGDLAETSGWIWLEPAREDLHRRAVDAHLRLAELEEAGGNTAAAEAVLEKLIDLDRYAEEPYRRLMSIQAGQRRSDAVKATWRQLQRRLIELDLDPDPATARLYRSLVAEEPAA